MNGGDSDYRQFRSEIDRLYPAVARRIALSRGELADDPSQFTADLRAQLSTDIAAMIRERADAYQRAITYEYRTALTLRNPIGNMCVNIHADHDPNGPVRAQKPDADPLARYAPSAGDAAACYIALNRRMSPRTQLQRMSDRSLHPLRMKFAQAAMNPDHMKWWSFYHELSHALIATGYHDTGRKSGTLMQRVYAHEMEESICDAYATIMTLRRFGEPCLPMLRATADMRRSLFAECGPHYYTAPAMDAAMADYAAGAFPADTADVFTHALGIARTQYLPFDNFAAGFLRLRAEQDKIFMRLTPRTKERLRATVAACYAGSELPEEQRTVAHRDAALRLVEAQTVLPRDYKNSLGAATAETGWRWARIPLHRAGWIRHPGY
jgi:hypothetical protein